MKGNVDAYNLELTRILREFRAEFNDEYEPLIADQNGMPYIRQARMKEDSKE